MRVFFFGLMFLLAIWLELTFGLGGVFFATSILACSWNSGGNWIFATCFFMSAGVADLVFGRPFGQTALIVGIALMCWHSVQNVSRWRFLAYVALGGVSTFFLSLSSAWRPSWLITFIALMSAWVIIRTLHVQRTLLEIHIL